MTDDNNPLLRIATLLDDLKHDEINVRVDSMRHLKEITTALGAQRTRDELLPFLGDTVLDDEDEVLLVAAEEFGDLVKEVGGIDHIPSLLKVLEELASVDEPTVRAKAVDSIIKLVGQMKNPAVNSHFVPMLRRLSEKDWFTSRSSACCLFHAGYAKMTDVNKAELRGLFGVLCKDDAPAVKKLAAQNIGKFAEVVEYSVMKQEIFPLFQDLSTDKHDSVRLSTVKNIIAFTKLETTQDKKQEILKTVFNLAEDPAWRVKWTVADSFLEISRLAVENNLDIPRFIRLYLRLLNDEEPEVRAAAVSKLTVVGNVYKANPANAEAFTDIVVPVLRSIVSDSSDFVRTEAASVLLGLAPVVGKDKAHKELVHLYLSLLKDVESQVRLNLIGSLDTLEQTIDVKEISDALLPSIQDLATDGQWRIRHSIIGHIPLIAKHLGKAVFDDKLVKLCMSWLQDEVFSIRQAATENLQKLTQLFGEDWARKEIFEKIEELSGNPSYLFRMQSLRAIESLAPVVSQDALNSELMAHVIKLATDPTPNIKFNVAKTIEKIADRLTPGVLSQDVKPCLEAMLKDEDDDVKYFGKRSLDVVMRAMKK